MLQQVKQGNFMASKKTKKNWVFKDLQNRKIRACSWIPAKTVSQLIVIHGFAEHMRNYTDTAEKLCNRGLAVHAMDLPGHGLSDGPRGYIDDFEEYIDNVDLFINTNPNILQSKPTFLLGHSLGGLIALQYCLRKKPKIKGLLLSSPFLGFSLLGSLPVLLTFKLLMRINPAMSIPKPLGVSSLCRNPNKWPDYYNDPYRLRSISPNVYLSMVYQAGILRSKAPNLKLPLLIFFTTKDRVVSPHAIQSFFQRSGSRDKTLVTFTEAMHELFQEKEQQQVVEKMVTWIQDRV